jgi:hypothetical protein
MTRGSDNQARGTGPAAASAADVAGELSAWAVGGGIITAALAPLAIPILALTAVAALPLVAVALVGGLAAALVTLPVLAARALVRRVGASRRSARTGGGPAGPGSPSRVTGAVRQSLSVADRPG